MNICVILQSLHQVLRIVEEIAKTRLTPLSLAGSAGSAYVHVVALSVGIVGLTTGVLLLASAILIILFYIALIAYQ